MNKIKLYLILLVMAVANSSCNKCDDNHNISKYDDGCKPINVSITQTILSSSQFNTDHHFEYNERRRRVDLFNDHVLEYDCGLLTSSGIDDLSSIHALYKYDENNKLERIIKRNFVGDDTLNIFFDDLSRPKQIQRDTISYNLIYNSESSNIDTLNIFHNLKLRYTITYEYDSNKHYLNNLNILVFRNSITDLLKLENNITNETIRHYKENSLSTYQYIYNYEYNSAGYPIRSEKINTGIGSIIETRTIEYFDCL